MMAFRWLLSVFLVAIAAILVASVPVFRESNKSGPGGGAGDENWDYFLFVQTSPAGNCYSQHYKDCSYPTNSTPWTMHGIWPTLSGTLGPNYCTKVTFSLSEVMDLLPQLIRQWTNTITTEPLDSFWDHEWVKHGSCALSISSMSNEHDFFKTTLMLHEKLNFTVVLESHGIEPSLYHKYKPDDFNQAFEAEMGVKPLLECLYSHEMGQVLYQVSVCLHKDFSFMPCEEYVFDSSKTKCYDNETFLYIPKNSTNY